MNFSQVRFISTRELKTNEPSAFEHRACQTGSPVPSRKQRHAAEDTEAQSKKTSVQPRALTGDVYALTAEDAQVITASDQIRGQIYLTNTLLQTATFITIPVSRKLSYQYAEQRPQVM
jgi:hypothetical protein